MDTKSQPNMSVDDFFKLYHEIDIKDRIISAQLEDKKVFRHEVKGRYPYIPFHSERKLFELFSYIKKAQEGCSTPLSLLDVGAGIGRIVFLAKSFGIPAKGIEFHKPYVEAGRKAFGLSKEELLVGDAFEMTPEFLQQFYMIYTYMPMYDAAMMTELHFSMVNKLQRLPENLERGKVSTIFVEMLPHYYPMSSVSVNDNPNSTSKIPNFPAMLCGTVVHKGLVGRSSW